MKNEEGKIKGISGVNNIKYKGTVTVKRIDKKGRVKEVTQHNTGKQALFNFLLFCLAYNYKNVYSPSVLMGYSGDEFAFTRFIPQTHTPVLYRNDGGIYTPTLTIPVHRVEYSFLVPAKYFKSNQVTKFRLINSAGASKSINDIASEGNADKYICAELDLESSIALTNDNLLVYWDLEFSESNVSE